MFTSYVERHLPHTSLIKLATYLATVNVQCPGTPHCRTSKCCVRPRAVAKFWHVGKPFGVCMNRANGDGQFVATTTYVG